MLTPSLAITLLTSLATTVKALGFTPETLLKAPRLAAGVPNSNATQILYQAGIFSSEKNVFQRQIRVLDASSKESTTVIVNPGVTDPTWVDDDGSVLLLVDGQNGTTDVTIGKVGDFEKTKYIAGNVDSSLSNLKLKPLDKDTYAFVVTAPTNPDGTLFNSEKAPTKGTTGSLYSSLFVRHWDTWTTPQRYSLWYGTLSATSRNSTGGRKYSLSKLTNAIDNPDLESPIPPFGGTDNFDVSTSGIAFVSKDPGLNPATHTKQNLYIVPRSNSSGFALGKAIKVNIAGFEGATTGPTFSPNGSSLAFTSKREVDYESDKNQLMVIPDVKRPERIEYFFATEDGKGKWDRNPTTIVWSQDAKTLYLEAEERGRMCIFSTPSNAISAQSTPSKIFTGGYIITWSVLANDSIFISATSIIDNSAYYLLDASSKASNASRSELIFSHSKEGSVFGLSRNQIEEIEYMGVKTKNHAWVIKPSNFQKGQRYPLAFVVHGGPQQSWTDNWGVKWSLPVYAEQGYVVVAPNPTGSSGFGQAFTDAIKGQWGGLPYQDLVKAFDHIKSELDFVDTDRAVALGASYGGYMINWIQGQPLGRKFKALVTHQGQFSMTGALATEELYFPFHDVGAKPWEQQEAWDKWDPSRFSKNWETPHLIIHSEKDFRVPISEGLSSFNVLQARGVDSKFLTYSDQGHFVNGLNNSLLWYKVVLDWINPRVGLPKWADDGVPGQLVKEATQDPGRKSTKP
ncbi:dipeptidyl-peptidase-like protein V precursor [Venturia nashicola]|uniref:Dipeptidyl-peptidase V n=1 Tax=Venturia nashicola TaxID=86259 RepID=A0A4Z1P980_9PEZI|nr:dipeptidyl-peptidase-like protein V precursor [Venturia nashicola]